MGKIPRLQSLLLACLILGRGLRSDSIQSLSSQGFHVLPNSIIKIEEALAKNATILFPPDMHRNQESVHTCADNCLQLTKCNLFVFSKKTSKCVLFDCKEPSICEFEDNHSMYVSAVRVKQKQPEGGGGGNGKSSQHAHKDCFPKFRCVTSAECIPLSYTCDRYIDCEDQSDELGCYSDYDADNDELSEYEKAYQKHTSTSSKQSASKTASSSSHSKSTSSSNSRTGGNRSNGHSSSMSSESSDKRTTEQQDNTGMPLSRAAIPGSAEVRTGKEPRKVLQPVRVKSKSKSSFEETSEKEADSSNLNEPYSDDEEYTDYISGIDLVDTEKPENEEKNSRTGGKIDDSGSNQKDSKKYGTKSNSNAEKNSASDGISLDNDVEIVSSHPMFDWLVGFVPEERLSMMTLIEMYQLAESACLSVPESGICTRAAEVEYYYNSTEEKCHPHHFSICATGMNRFESNSACMAVCGAMKRSTDQVTDQDGEAEESREKEVKKDGGSFDQSSKDGKMEKGSGPNSRSEQTSRRPEPSAYDRNDNYYQSSSSRDRDREDNYRERFYDEESGGRSRIGENSRYSSDGGSDYYSSKRKQANNRYYDSYSSSESVSDANRNSAWGYEAPTRTSSRYHDEPSSSLGGSSGSGSGSRPKAGTSGNMRNEEPVYWEQFHHGSGTHNNVHGKTDPDDFELQELRLTVEKPALINFDDDYSGSLDYDSDIYVDSDQLSRGRDREQDDSEVVKGESTKKSPGYDTQNRNNEKEGVDGSPEADQRVQEVPSDDGIAISAAVPLILGLSVFLLFTVLLSIRCYFWNRYPTAISRRRMKKFFKDKNDYLVDGMYL